MTAGFILSIIGGYFLVLFGISLLTGRKSDNATFFKGNQNSPWYLVAFGMIGASLSGVTFISVPGWVATTQFSYMQMVLGYLLGYAVIAFVLMPMYYRLNLTSIYGYLEKRMGLASYKTGAAFFLLSRTIGAAFRLYLVAIVLHDFVLADMGIPFAGTVMLSIALIWIYTFRGGIKTVVWTDTLQTLFMLLAAGFAIWMIKDELGWSVGDMVSKIAESEYSKTWFWDVEHSKFFLKQVLSGAFIAIVMTGLDQDMMQKNLTCRNLREAQWNMSTFSIILVFVNLGFLMLGALLYMYGIEQGQVELADGKLFLASGEAGAMVQSETDKLFPFLALNSLPPVVGILFILGLVAAAYSSADSALTALTTSVCVDFLDFEKKTDEKSKAQTRMFVHIGVSVVVMLVILLFRVINDQSVISAIFKVAGYTYGPLLGMYALGMLTKWKVWDMMTPLICIASPLISFGIDYITGGWLGFSVLLVNGAITFVLMAIASAIRPEEEPAI